MKVDTILRVFEEAKKKAKKPPKKEKPEDPNEVARKKRGLTHNVGHVVHAGLGVKGGAGYRGTVVKIDDDHTYIDIGNKRIVKAPHRLVSAHEEVVHEESKEQKKERIRREADRAARAFRDYEELEDKIETRNERSKRRHERARRNHQEETNSEKRMKVSNLSRPNDPPVTSKKSVLDKTLKIKNIIIDEE